MASPNTLYRFYTSAGDLLYVGITCNPGRRLEKHRAGKSWWSDVARIEMEQHADRAALLAAERAAISTERPVHNIRLNGTGGRAAPRPVALPKGLIVGEAYALGLSDGSCPVGLIQSGDEDGVVITPYSWIVSRFGLEDEWIDADLILRWCRAEQLSDRLKDSRGYDRDATVFSMDALGDFQTAWKRREAAPA